MYANHRQVIEDRRRGDSITYQAVRLRAVATAAWRQIQHGTGTAIAGWIPLTAPWA